MSPKDLSKEQKQYVALGLLAAAIIVILVVLGIRFSMATVSAAKEELDDLTTKINSANDALSKSRKTSEDYVATAEVLRKYLTNAPPERNYYSWATEVIYSKARFADLEIDSIDEISIPQRQISGPEGPAAISFESYSLRIMAHGGYENTKYFLNLLKQDYPLVRFSGVEISSGQSADTHDVQLFMQWPFNFGEISKNWDAVASRKLKVAESPDSEEVTAFKEPETVQEPAALHPPVATPESVREPYPPTTRPGVEDTAAPKYSVEPAAAESQSVMDAGFHVSPSPVDTATKQATDDEIQAIISNVASPSAGRMEAERPYTIKEPASNLESQPVKELEIIAPEPAPVIESAVVPESVVDPQSIAVAEPVEEPESGIEHQPESVVEQQTPSESMTDHPVPAADQELLQLISEFEKRDSAPILDEPTADAKEAAPPMDTPFASEVDPAPERSIDPPSIAVPEVPGTYDSTGKSETILEEHLSKESTGEDASLRSLLDSLVGELNEK